MYVVESEVQTTELGKVAGAGAGQGNSAFTYDYTTADWVEDN